eukprot:206307-Chlamydomonas_euryale.AAC.7
MCYTEVTAASCYAMPMSFVSSSEPASQPAVHPSFRMAGRLCVLPVRCFIQPASQPPYMF